MQMQTMKTKYTTKIPINLTIDKEIYKEFSLVAKAKYINKSALIQDFIKNWIANEKK